MRPHAALTTIALLAAATVLGGCTGRPDRSAFVGGVAGAAAGNQLSRGGAAATIGGAAIGAAIGADGAMRGDARRRATAQQPAQGVEETR